MGGKKCIRFGLVFEGPREPSGEFLDEIGAMDAEGIHKDGKQYMLFTVSKSRRTTEVLQAIDAFNSSKPADEAVRLVAYEPGSSLILTFERGNKYQSHPIYKIISGLGHWTRSTVMASDKQKRAITELQTDLVQDCIVPSSSKRVSGEEGKKRKIADGGEPTVVASTGEDNKENDNISNVKQTGKKPKSSKKKSTITKKKHPFVVVPSSKIPPPSSRPIDSVDLMMLVSEVTRSKDETIQAKDQTIRLLESMRRSCASCAVELQVAQ